MKNATGALAILAVLWSAAAVAAPTRSPVHPLTSSDVGVYGTLFDFCDYSVYKFSSTGAVDERKTALWNRRLHRAIERGKQNLVLIYTFDRIKYARPLEEYIRNTDALLSALDLKAVYAVCLAEENVPWNNGLKVLNGLYAHIRKHYPVPVYQWLSNPLPPHPSLAADGWIIDPYGFRRDRFRRYLQKYLVTGLPVIDCISASPYPGAPFDQSVRDQVAVCREFNVPMFFFCVDRRWGSPDIWLRCDAPDVAAARAWLLDVVSRLHREGSAGLPLLSADYSTGRRIEAAGDLQGNYAYQEDFSDSDFLDDPNIRGFRGLRWMAARKSLSCTPGAAGIGLVELQYHFVSPFQIVRPQARILGRLTTGAKIALGVSPNGYAWKDRRERKRAGAFDLDVAIPGDAPLPDREFWVRITVSAAHAPEANAVLSSLTVKCRTLPPAERVIRLKPDENGRVVYRDTFASARFLHFADIQGLDRLEWQRGRISTHGVPGRAHRVAVRWHFKAERPLRGLVVTVKGSANGPNLGAENTVGLSLDGKTLLLSASTAKQKRDRNGWSQGDLVLDAASRPELRDVCDFYVHVILTNRSGVRTGPSNIIHSLEVRANTAKVGSSDPAP